MRLWVISPSPTFITFEEAANAGFMEKNMDANTNGTILNILKYSKRWPIDSFIEMLLKILNLPMNGNFINYSFSSFSSEKCLTVNSSADFYLHLFSPVYLSFLLNSEVIRAVLFTLVGLCYSFIKVLSTYSFEKYCRLIPITIFEVFVTGI